MKPGRSRNPAKHRAPARGPWQVIDGQSLPSTSSLNATRVNTGGVAQEIDSRQTTVSERPVSDAGNTVGDRHAGQVVTIGEGIGPDVGDAVAYRDIGQAIALIERIEPDVGNVVGDCDAGQAGAIIKRPIPDAGDAVRNRDASQDGVVFECPAPDAGDRQIVDCARNGDCAGNHRAIGNGVSRNDDCAVIGRVSELIPSYSCKPVKRRTPVRGSRRVIDSRIGVAVEHRRTKNGSITLEIDSGEVGAGIKRAVPNIGNAIGDGNADQVCAIRKRIGSDAGDRQLLIVLGMMIVLGINAPLATVYPVMVIVPLFVV